MSAAIVAANMQGGETGPAPASNAANGAAAEPETAGADSQEAAVSKTSKKGKKKTSMKTLD